MSTKTQTAVKAAAIALTLFSFGAQALPFTPGPSGQAPADHPTEYQPWSTEMIWRAKHPVAPLATPAAQSNMPEAPRVGTVEAQQRAKYPWLYPTN